MKKISTLLMCLIMVFAMGFPVNADVIEVDKPAEPKSILVKEIKTVKSAYHQGDKISFYIKATNITEKAQDVEYGIIYFQTMPGGKTEVKLNFDKSSNKFYGDVEVPVISEGKYSVSIKNIFIHYKSEDSTRVICGQRMFFVINNNCADNNHTVYKNDWKMEKDSTCTEEGKENRYCSICGQLVESRSIPKTNSHKKSSWITTKNPTLYKEGTKIIKCVECEKILQTQKISKLPSTIQLKFSKKSITIKKGKTVKLKYTRKPVGAKDVLIWKSSKPKIAKVLKNGKVKGLKKGKTIITLKAGNKKTKITVKVK